MLEHIHLGWAWFGWLIRLPLISYIAQLLLEHSFAKPLAICKRPKDGYLVTKESNKGDYRDKNKAET